MQFAGLLFEPFGPRISLGIVVAASLAAVGLICGGLQQRALLPGTPLWDPDTWGYLRPALGIVNGEPFRQVDGRHGFYPTLLVGFLSGWGGFPAILRWQQILGAFSALLLWGVWAVWWRLLPASRARDLLAPAAGLGLLGLFYQNPTTILFEAALRPEAVIYFFGFFQLFCAAVFLLIAGTDKGRSGIVLAGTLSVFLAYCCFCLKPSWAFAAVFTSLPVVFEAVRPGRNRPAAMCALAAAALCIGGMFAAYKVWIHPDNSSRTFLASTLFTIHADLIQAAFLRDPPPGDAEKIHAMLPMLTAELDYARQHPGTYKTLGFDADYLMYRSRFGEPLVPFHLEPADYAAFLYRSYLSAWKSDPAGMLRKIFRQAGLFFVPAQSTFLSNKTEVRRDSATSWEIEQSQGEWMKSGAAGDLLRANRALAADAAETGLLLRSPGWVRPLRVWLSASAPLLVPVFFLSLGLCGLARSRLLTSGWAVALFFSAAFGNALTVCVIHALDIERYCKTFGPFLALSLVAMAVWLALALLEFLNRPPQTSQHHEP